MKSIKKLLCISLAISITGFCTVMPIAAYDDIPVILDGNRISFDVQPQIINDRTMVPLRAIFESLGATVEWDNATQTVTSKRNDTTVKLTVNDSTMYVNNHEVKLDAPPCIIDGRTLVPVRAIAEAYDINVQWYDTVNSVCLRDMSSSKYDSVHTAKSTLINEIKANRGSVFAKNGVMDISLFGRSPDYLEISCTNASTGTRMQISFNDAFIGIMVTPTGKVEDSNFYHVDYLTHETFGYLDNPQTFDSLKSLIETSYSNIDTVLSTHGFSVTLKDLGFSLDSFVGTSATYDPYEKLKTTMVETGRLSNDKKSYQCLYEYDSLSIFMSYNTEKDLIGMMLDFDSDTQILLRVHPDTVPDMIVHTNMNSSERQLVGTFPTDTKTFTKLQSSLSSYEEPVVINTVIPSALQLFDSTLNSKGFGVTLNDFGITYTAK